MTQAVEITEVVREQTSEQVKSETAHLLTFPEYLDYQIAKSLSPNSPSMISPLAANSIA